MAQPGGAATQLLRGRSVDDLMRAHAREVGMFSGQPANAPSMIGSAAFSGSFQGLSGSSAWRPLAGHQPAGTDSAKALPVALPAPGAANTKDSHDTAPADASNFDMLFGRTQSESDDYKARKVASAFDVYFGGNATVVAPPSPSQASQSRDGAAAAAGDAGTSGSEAGATARTGGTQSRMSRPKSVTDLIIPTEKEDDPSDDPMHCDSSSSPRTLLSETPTAS
eukprot:CAMPEP_0206234598 /NCGR_PEP_ID=MMETSP0047_2-20121206/12678_1 /ASSEMBLY_ACC=CAM_ASM_000192 /TAXON_ID=195065 /ORGANISM="Chroomonas mesostigmatica_cf, Strain CCMP1168" /LENGTH=222 /DNA_ID=CAMNT_0053658699 /DNA_START=25 /DNA_END=693 /DNA_ORIENTATION=-